MIQGAQQTLGLISAELLNIFEPTLSKEIS